MERKDNDKITGSGISTGSHDPLKTTTYGKLNGLYYYYLEEGIYNYGSSDSTAVLGTTSAISNVAYVPFLNIKASELLAVPFDERRYGKTGLGKNPSVFRIQKYTPPTPMELSRKKLYPIGQHLPATHDNRHWSHESRLLDYPYRSIIFASNVFEQYQIVPHMMNEAFLDKGDVKLECIQTINPGGNFYLTIKGYKSDSYGLTERQYSSVSMDIPNTSSAYSNYMSTQKAQAGFAVKNQLFQAALMPIQGAVNGVATGGSIPGMIGGAVAGSVSGLVHGGISAATTIGSHLAMKQDLMTTPKSISSSGGDIITKLGNENGTYVISAEMTITDEYKRLLGDYFAMYGYKQNKIMPLQNHLRTRHYYNYIKTVGCNVTGTGVPKEHLSEIKAIFDKGVTLWHVGSNGGKFMDYSKDNSERKVL